MQQFAAVAFHPEDPLIVVLVPLLGQVGLAYGFQKFPCTFAFVIEVHGIASLGINSVTVTRMKQCVIFNDYTELKTTWIEFD
jgi:hypothetical protein